MGEFSLLRLGWIFLELYILSVNGGEVGIKRGLLDEGFCLVLMVDYIFWLIVFVVLVDIDVVVVVYDKLIMIMVGRIFELLL